MKKVVIVVISLCMMFFFMVHNVMTPIWISVASHTRSSSPVKASSRWIRFMKVQGQNNAPSDLFDDPGEEINNNRRLKKDNDIYLGIEEADGAGDQTRHTDNEADKHRDKIIYSGGVDNESPNDEESEVLRLEKSPYIVNEEEERKLMSTEPQMSKVILVSEWKLPTPFRNSFKICRYNKCKWVADNTIADAVLFRASSVRDSVIKPFRRKPGQRWIFYTSDPAAKAYRLEGDDVASNFNATSTYQLHSDYPRIFGRLRKIKPPEKDYEKIFDGKKKQVAWFVSHCTTWSKRELYVERMRKIIPVDVFGACGNFTCTGAVHRKSEDGAVCLPMLTKQYKFYLSFENSFCKDYISEKFFKLFQDVDVIPVVQGAVDYKKLLPSNIFIDSADFKTPEDLARYLLWLGKDKAHYVKMLKNKSRWTFWDTQPRHCVICQGLHTDTRKQHYYRDMVAAFNGRPSECHPPKWLET